MQEPPSPAIPPDGEPAAGQEAARAPAISVDEMGEASFPASDPPAVWTWEVDRDPPEPTAG